MKLPKLMRVGKVYSSVGAYYDPALFGTGYHDGLNGISKALELLEDEAVVKDLGLVVTATQIDESMVISKSLRTNTTLGLFYHKLYVNGDFGTRAVVMLNANKLTTVKHSVETLCHELVHFDQCMTGRMAHDSLGRMFEGRHYSHKEMRKLGYEAYPWEVEAFGRQHEMSEKLCKRLEEQFEITAQCRAGLK